ncbi:uncharacterized protein PAE49_001801 isoform 2-T2 [Odontesthes bonariensis]|uniref:uncharacterized protein LOC142375293 isoform X2 n=1 Tax=Odontesthes bonariensis TaxID=219752 RepID=UPI003F58F24F
MSESPEEQPSTGVLGRIGSWLSPWKGTAPKAPNENASSTNDCSQKTEGDEECDNSVRTEAEKQKWLEEKPISVNPLRDFLPCQKEDATQSAHRGSSAVSSTEAEGGGPKEEELIECRKLRTGQCDKWEENSNGTSASGNPVKNVSHLTNLSSSSKQGVVWDSDQAHTQPHAQRQAHAQTGNRLHVYLEETSVIQLGQDSCAKQEVVCTTVKKSLKVLPKAKSSTSYDSPNNPTSAEKNVRTTVGAQSHYSAVVGVSLKLHKDSQFESEPDKEQTEAENMGRKNAARRKVKKNSQGDGGNSPLEKKPANAQPTAGFPSSGDSVASPQGKCPDTHKKEASAGSSLKHNPTLKTSPEGGESKIACSDMAKQLDNLQNSASVTDATQTYEVDGSADMEDDDSLYKVKRKTETPESKRRSIKVSQSEVKFFSKHVPLNPKKTQVGDHQDFTATLQNTNDETKEKPKTETDARLQDPKKAVDGSKSVSGRIADKINLFEQQKHDRGYDRTFQTPRSADVSPSRKVAGRFKADCLLSEQRSKSAERWSTARSSSSSPAREKPMTIKERVRRFTEAEGKPAATQVPAKTGLSQKSTSSVGVASSKLLELDNQAKLDSKEQTHTKPNSATRSKPDRQDNSADREHISTPEVPVFASKTKETVVSKTANQDTKPNSVERAADADDSSDMTNTTIPDPKGPSRTGSHSKKRKSKEPKSPISPNIQSKPKVTAMKKEQVDGTEEMLSASKQLPEKVSLPSHKLLEDTSDKQPFNDTKQQALKRETEVSDKQKELLDFSFKKKNIDKPPSRQEGSPESPVNKDEPDTASRSSGTKEPIDKKLAILPQMEEKSEKHSPAFTLGRKNASEDLSETSASSPSITPSVDQPLEKPPAVKQEPLAEQPKLDKELSVQPISESKGKGKMSVKEETRQTQQPQNKDAKLICQTQTEDVKKIKLVGCEKKNKDKTLELLPSEKSPTKAKDSHSGHGISKKDGSVKEAKQPETASQSSEKTSGSSALPVQTQHASQMVTAHPEKAAICTISQTNEAVSGTEHDKEPQKVETATNAPPESQIQPPKSPGTEREPVVTAGIPPPESVSAEKTENSFDDSCTHGANDAELSNLKPITKATTADEKVSSKVTNDVSLIMDAHTVTAPKVKKDSSASEPSIPFIIKPSAVKSVPPEGKISGEILKPALSDTWPGESKNTESTSNISLLGEAAKITQSPSDNITSCSTVDEKKNTAEKRFSPLVNKLSPIANSNSSSHSQLHTVKKEPIEDNTSRIPKGPTFPELIPGSINRSSMRKLHLPPELSKDDFSKQQDAPSSWLDVDFPKRKLKLQQAKLTSSGSESNLLDTSGELDDDDFIERIKKLCAPFSLPPRKHNYLRTPQPPFAMPAIREDRFEKPFDPEEFTFGLSKKTQFILDSTPGLTTKLQSKETKSGLIPARASFTERSMLFSHLETPSSQDKNPVKDEEVVKQEKDDQIKVKSRLENSCVLSSLTSSNFRGKKNEVQTLAQGTDSGNVSPSSAPQLSPLPFPQPAPPSMMATAAMKDTLAMQSKEEVQTAEVVVSDSGPPFPSFNDIKLPDYLEKYLPQEQTKPMQSVQGPEQIKPEFIGKMTSLVSGGKADVAEKPSLVLPEIAAPSFPGSPPTTHPTPPELKPPLAQPHGILGDNIKHVKGFHKRPGKMVLFEKAQFSGQAYEIYRDVADASSLQLSPQISVKVFRGCWVLYEKPHFEGRMIALEEGNINLENVWAEPGPETEAQNSPPMLIGSIRLAVRDYSIPHIDLFTEPEGLGRVTPYHDDTIETGSFGIPLNTASIQVHSGVWQVCSDPGFQGMVSLLETGVYPVPETWGFPSPFVGSLRPLKMGGIKVEKPDEVKAVVYEKPGFEGSSLEIDSDVFSFCEADGGIATNGTNLDTKRLKSVGSLKITGGFWVGYSQPGFEGQQHILEEGEYLDCSEWGGSELQSMRLILSDFLAPHMKMFSDRDFGKLGVNIDLTVPVINMDDTGYGMRTQSIDVIGGVWVVFEEPGFCGESFILEKGLYGSPEDWGALQHRVGSAMPVTMNDFENTAKFKVQLFSDPGFQGSLLTLEDSTASLPDGFSVASCKVLAGSWLAFEGQDFTGKMYVLEAGSYPDLRAMGCVSGSSSILSLQTVGFEFSLPSITFFERCALRGKRVLFTEGSVNLQLAGGCGRVQSVQVDGGVWILYEGINYRGAQILLKPGVIPDWRKFCSWQKIGSLRPLIQRQVPFRLRNRQTGLMMSVTGDLEDLKMLRIQETEETDGFEQIWFYQNGHLHCKLLEECCLTPSNSVTMAGYRVGLSLDTEAEIHLWSITPDGFIRYTPTADLVLDVKGGSHYDKNHVILNTLNPNRLQQRWDVEII